MEVKSPIWVSNTKWIPVYKDWYVTCVPWLEFIKLKKNRTKILAVSKFVNKIAHEWLQILSWQTFKNRQDYWPYTCKSSEKEIFIFSAKKLIEQENEIFETLKKKYITGMKKLAENGFSYQEWDYSDIDEIDSTITTNKYWKAYWWSSTTNKWKYGNTGKRSRH